MTLLMLVTMSNLIASRVPGAMLKNSLTVTIDGLRDSNGQVCLSLFRSGKGFPSSDDSALQARCVTLAEATSEITFDRLHPGTYAVAVFHDANGDGIFNTNALGIPKEGFGFSRNPTILAKPPKFSDAAVVIVGSNNNLQIQLKYLLGA